MITEEILAKLKDVENTYGVTILFAVESGSREWGFASENSDYDVRFVYAHPLEWYLSVHNFKTNNGKGEIKYELNETFDIVGWDLQKAMYYMAQSNATITEWIHASQIYMERFDSISLLKAAMNSNKLFNIKRLYDCYRGHLINDFKDLSEINTDKAPIKKVLYMMREILVCVYLNYYKSAPEHNDLSWVCKQLRGIVPENILDIVGELIVKKKSFACELNNIKIPKCILNYVSEISEKLLCKTSKTNPGKLDYSDIDRSFRDILGIVDGKVSCTPNDKIEDYQY